YWSDASMTAVLRTVGWVHISDRVVDQLAAVSASRFVGSDDHPFGRNQTVNQLEVAARSVVIEEAATLAKHEWVDEKHIPVNELRRKQRSHQLPTAHDAQVGAWFGIDLGNAIRRVA